MLRIGFDFRAGRLTGSLSIMLGNDRIVGRWTTGLVDWRLRAGLSEGLVWATGQCGQDQRTECFECDS
jgi:hypothetical protein